MSIPPSRTSPPRVSQCWLLLAVASLGFAALAAIILVLARTPFLTNFVTHNLFPHALVVHVNLATTIWYWAMANALWTESLPRPRHALAMALATISAAGALGVVWEGLAATERPVLANYIPYVDSYGFLASLAIFAGGTAGSAMLSLRRPQDAVEWGFAIARWPFLMGLAYLVIGLLREMPLAEVFWGVGHLLQFGYVTLLMAIWLRLAERAGNPRLSPAWAAALFSAAALPATVAPALLLSGPVDTEMLHTAHTRLMQFANWPAPLLLTAVLALRNPKITARGTGLPASMALLIGGIVAGLLITTQTTVIPAHYHGTIGAFTLAQMAAVLIRATPPGHPVESRIPGSISLWLYALGIGTLIIGLAWSGLLGAARKTGFDGQGADLPAILAGTTIGIGGALTIFAICLFVLFTLPRIAKLCLPQSRQEPPPSPAATFAAAQ